MGDEPFMCGEKTRRHRRMTTAAPSKETILVVDDEASIRRILETRLSMIGYNVVTACDGTEALELFENTAPDLVVLDVMMPKLDGYGCLLYTSPSPRDATLSRMPSSA